MGERVGVQPTRYLVHDTQIAPFDREKVLKIVVKFQFVINFWEQRSNFEPRLLTKSPAHSVTISMAKLSSWLYIATMAEILLKVI